MQLPILFLGGTADLMCLASQLSQPEVEWKGDKKYVRVKQARAKRGLTRIARGQNNKKSRLSYALEICSAWL